MLQKMFIILYRHSVYISIGHSGDPCGDLPHIALYAAFSITAFSVHITMCSHARNLSDTLSIQRETPGERWPSVPSSSAPGTQHAAAQSHPLHACNPQHLGNTQVWHLSGMQDS